MDSSPTQVSEAQVSQEVAKPAKEKKPRTEAQQAATQKALAAMTARRKQLIEEKKEKKEVIQKAKKVVEEKILKEDLGFVVRKDYEATISSLSKEIGELKALYAQAQKPKAEPAPKERIVERIIEKQAPTQQATPQKLTGYALLDKVFFEK